MRAQVAVLVSLIAVLAGAGPADAAWPPSAVPSTSPAARKKVAKQKELVVSIKVTFTPKSGGKKVTKTTKVTLRKVTAVRPDIRP